MKKVQIATTITKKKFNVNELILKVEVQLKWFPSNIP